ncbi:MAG: copper chaperone PCu(A)C [Burkholderiales bacterium]|nr:copper chaperone PCu(A)C [Burkholderiales bacterium]
MKNLIPQRLGTALVLALSIGSALSQTTIDDAWVRATVPQQKATGMFAHITSTQGGRLVAAASPVAAVVEIHEMAMDGNVMRMRALAAGLELPAGKTVKLKPGGYHVMLMDLKAQVKAGDTVPVTLVVEDKDGKRETLEVKATARALGAAAPSGGHKH